MSTLDVSLLCVWSNLFVTHRRAAHKGVDLDQEEDRIEEIVKGNGTSLALELKDGVYNQAFSNDERFTKLWDPARALRTFKSFNTTKIEICSFISYS